MIKPLPYWVVPDSFPAFYETEGATAIQQTAKIYGKIQELIEDYNKFVDQVNEHIREYETNMNQSYDEFKQCVIKLMNDYIETIDTKINMQDDKIQEAIDYMKDNLESNVTDLFNQAIQNGDIRANLRLEYIAKDERLNISIESGEN